MWNQCSKRVLFLSMNKKIQFVIFYVIYCYQNLKGKHSIKYILCLSFNSQKHLPYHTIQTYTEILNQNITKPFISISLGSELVLRWHNPNLPPNCLSKAFCKYGKSDAESTTTTTTTLTGRWILWQPNADFWSKYFSVEFQQSGHW